MTRLALEEFPVAVFADKFAIAHGDLPAHGDVARTAFQFPAFKRAVVEIHVLCLHGDFAAIVWVEHHEVGVRTGLDRAFARASRGARWEIRRQTRSRKIPPAQAESFLKFDRRQSEV